MKKNNSSKINKAERNETDRLSDKAVLLTALTILYAFLLLFLQWMSRDIITIPGAMAFTKILFWGSIIGAMACAAWGAYREKKAMFLYSGIFVYILWSMAVILRCGNMGADKAYALVYLSLIAAFILIQLYFGLRSSGKMQSKKSKIIFTVVSVLIFIAFTVAAAALATELFGFRNAVIGK